LNNAVKYIKHGFISFGYFPMNTEAVDFFVADTRSDYFYENLTTVRKLIEKTGSELKIDLDREKPSMFSFTVKCSPNFTKTQQS